LPVSNSFKILAICCGENLLRLIILSNLIKIILILNSSVLGEAYRHNYRKVESDKKANSSL
ncbi:hypothetical protein LB452_02710, partial [Psychroflexus sp. CAK8W]